MGHCLIMTSHINKSLHISSYQICNLILFQAFLTCNLTVSLNFWGNINPKLKLWNGNQKFLTGKSSLLSKLIESVKLSSYLWTSLSHIATTFPFPSLKLSKKEKKNGIQITCATVPTLYFTLE